MIWEGRPSSSGSCFKRITEKPAELAGITAYSYAPAPKPTNTGVHISTCTTFLQAKATLLRGARAPADILQILRDSPVWRGQCEDSRAARIRGVEN